MRRGRILILFAMVLIFGVVAVYLLLGRGGGGGGQVTTPEGPGIPSDMTQIVIAAQDISRGSVIPDNGVTLAPYPADMVVETMIENDLSVVVGRYARQDIARGAPITSNMITRRAGDLLGTGSEAAIAIPPGYTAISVPMNRLSGVAYALEAGDRVDVLITLLMVDMDPDFQTMLPNESLALVSPDGTLLTALVCRELKYGDRGPECTNPEPVMVGRVDVEETTSQPIFSHPVEDQRPRLVTQRLVENAAVLHVGTFVSEDELHHGGMIFYRGGPGSAGDRGDDRDHRSGGCPASRLAAGHHHHHRHPTGRPGDQLGNPLRGDARLHAAFAGGHHRDRYRQCHTAVPGPELQHHGALPTAVRPDPATRAGDRAGAAQRRAAADTVTVRA